MHTKFEGSARKQNAFSAKTVCEFFTFPTPLLMKKSPFEIILDQAMNQSNTYHQNLRGKFFKNDFRNAWYFEKSWRCSWSSFSK